MEASDSVLSHAPSAVKGIICLLINGILPAVLTTVKFLYGQKKVYEELRTESSDLASNMDIDGTAEPSAINTWTAGYYVTSLPKKLRKLINDDENRSLLSQFNRVIKEKALHKIAKLIEDAELTLKHEALRQKIVTAINEQQIFQAFSLETATKAIEVCKSEEMTTWLVEKATADAIIQASKTQDNDMVKKNTSRKPNAQQKSLQNKKQAGEQNKNVSTGSINIIGKIYIPKTLYNLLQCGNKFVIECAQSSSKRRRSTKNEFFQTRQR